MHTAQPTPSPQPSATPARRSLLEVAPAFDLARACADHTSTRDLAARLCLPASTFHRLDQRRRRLEASGPPWAAFFLSASGAEFLRMMLLALHLIFGLMGANGCALICRFLDLLGLQPFVGTSDEAQRQVSLHVQDLLTQYEAAQRARLAPILPPRPCAVGVDETFPHAGQSLLIAQDLCSGYILMQQFSERRDAKTWADALTPQLHALGVVAEQIVSDQAPGLKGLARTLGAAHTIDLFHVQQPVVKDVVGACARRRRTTQRDHQKVCKKIATQAAAQAAASAAAQTPPPALEDMSCAAEVDLNAAAQPPRAPAEAAPAPPPAPARRGRQPTEPYPERAARLADKLSEAKAAHRFAKAAVRGVGWACHPFDLICGAWQEPAQMSERLERMTQMLEAAHQTVRSVRGDQALAQWRKDLVQLQAQLERQQARSVQMLADSGFEPTQQVWIKEVIVGSIYIQQARARLPKTKERQALTEGLQRLEERFWTEVNEVLKTEEERAKAQALGEEISKKFQRSTSSVEGYNGVLGLKHHGWHRLPEGKLRAVGVLHNFYIKRADGTTAAERLLGEKPDDLWAWIAERFRKLPLPRLRPSFDPSSVQIH